MRHLPTSVVWTAMRNNNVQRASPPRLKFSISETATWHPPMTVPNTREARIALDKHEQRRCDSRSKLTARLFLLPSLLRGSRAKHTKPNESRRLLVSATRDASAPPGPMGMCLIHQAQILYALQMLRLPIKYPHGGRIKDGRATPGTPRRPWNGATNTHPRVRAPIC